MRLLAAALLLSVGLLASCSVEAQGETESGLEWEPRLDQPIRQLEEVLAALEQQQPMNYTISNIAFLYDAQLYVEFHRFLDGLPASRRAEELAEQEAWLAERKRKIQEAYAEFEGGSLASYVAGQASIDCTKARLAELRAE